MELKYTIEDLKKAFEAGQESKCGYIHENFGSPYIEYEYESFEDWFKDIQL